MSGKTQLALPIFAPSAAEGSDAPPESVVSSAEAAESKDLPREDRLSALRACELEAQACQACGLAARRNSVVFGEGNPDAAIMFVGEGPGAEEDAQGRPFVGAAGQLLDRILAAAGLRREEVYIANVVKCRPPGNRIPAPEEAQSCSKFLTEQIRLIQPSIIVALGATAAKALVDPEARITRIRGSWFRKDGIWIMPTFHPAALLRDPSKKRPVWEDMKSVLAKAGELGIPVREV